MGKKIIVYVDPRGRITLPSEFRKAVNLQPLDKVWIEILEGKKYVHLGRVKVSEEIID